MQVMTIKMCVMQETTIKNGGFEIQKNQCFLLAADTM